MALAVGALLGAIVGFAYRMSQSEFPAGSPAAASGNVSGPAERAPGIEDSVAWRYARAYQEGDWERVLELTPWARERLDLVLETEGPEAAEAARDELLASFGARSVLENQLRDDGVEDQYVFAPGATLGYVSEDEGREGLELPVARRTWLRVDYPAREKALLDQENIPIRSVRVGVNVSHDGQVLKANVVGNLDIDWESVRYDWPRD
ncbi:MAG: hypothetical protein KF886_10875 [Candidatus Hydrogenedentes bacterium]|nr:hypothetical protein [Candidatus Hydrogenedentota bacterium]